MTNVKHRCSVVYDLVDWLDSLPLCVSDLVGCLSQYNQYKTLHFLLASQAPARLKQCKAPVCILLIQCPRKRVSMSQLFGFGFRDRHAGRACSCSWTWMCVHGVCVCLCACECRKREGEDWHSLEVRGVGGWVSFCAWVGDPDREGGEAWQIELARSRAR